MAGMAAVGTGGAGVPFNNGAGSTGSARWRRQRRRAARRRRANIRPRRQRRREAPSAGAAAAAAGWAPAASGHWRRRAAGRVTVLDFPARRQRRLRGRGRLRWIFRRRLAAAAAWAAQCFNYGGKSPSPTNTLTGNTAQGGNGANNSGSYSGEGLGGAIFNRNGSLTLTNSTISGNTAANGGRGVYNLGDGATATATINNIIIGQADTAVSDFVGATINGGTSTSSGVGDLIRTAINFGGTIVSNADPQLSPLASNGGPTQTMAIAFTSPALNGGDTTIATRAGLTDDQRGAGFPRVAGTSVDIGAYEAQDSTPPTAVLTPPNDVFLVSDITTTITITYSDTGSGIAPASLGVGNITVSHGSTTAAVSAISVSGTRSRIRSRLGWHLGQQPAGDLHHWPRRQPGRRARPGRATSSRPTPNSVPSGRCHPAYRDHQQASTQVDPTTNASIQFTVVFK